MSNSKELESIKKRLKFTRSGNNNGTHLVGYFYLQPEKAEMYDEMKSRGVQDPTLNYDLSVLSKEWDFEEIVARLYALSCQKIFKQGDNYKTSFEVFGTYKGCVFTLYDWKGSKSINIGGTDALDFPNFIKDLAVLLKNTIPKKFKAMFHYDDSAGKVYRFMDPKEEEDNEKKFCKCLLGDDKKIQSYIQQAKINLVKFLTKIVQNRNIEAYNKLTQIGTEPTFTEVKTSLARVIKNNINDGDINNLHFIIKNYGKDPIHLFSYSNKSQHKNENRYSQIFAKFIFLYSTIKSVSKNPTLLEAYMFASLSIEDHTTLYIHRPELYTSKPIGELTRVYIRAIKEELNQYFPKEISDMILQYL